MGCLVLEHPFAVTLSKGIKINLMKDPQEAKFYITLRLPIYDLYDPIGFGTQILRSMNGMNM